MSIQDLVLLLLLPVAIAVSGLCAASETALFSLTYSDRLRLSRASPRMGAAVGWLLARPRGFLLSILLLTNLANVTYFVVSSVLGRRIPDQGLAVAVNIAGLLALIFLADLLPKLLARSRRVEFARAAAPMLVVVMRAVGPVSGVLERAVVEPIMRLVRPARPDAEQAVTTEELAALLELSTRAGDIEADEQRLLGDVVDLGTTRVRDVMTPRVAMPWVSDSALPRQVLEVLRGTAATRVPVFRGSRDGQPLGLLDVKRYLAAVGGGSGGGGVGVKVASFLLPALFVPERAKLDQLLERFRIQGQSMALCVDELGAVEGMVEIGDVLDELVSPRDEAEAAPAGGVERLGPDRWVIPGRLSVRELAEYFFGSVRGRGWGGGGGLDRRASSVGGLIFAELDRVPRAGDSIRIGNVRLTVRSMNGRAVGQVEVTVAGAREGRGGRGGASRGTGDER